MVGLISAILILLASISVVGAAGVPDEYFESQEPYTEVEEAYVYKVIRSGNNYDQGGWSYLRPWNRELVVVEVNVDTGKFAVDVFDFIDSSFEPLDYITGQTPYVVDLVISADSKGLQTHSPVLGAGGGGFGEGDKVNPFISGLQMARDYCSTVPSSNLCDIVVISTSLPPEIPPCEMQECLEVITQARLLGSIPEVASVTAITVVSTAELWDSAASRSMTSALMTHIGWNYLAVETDIQGLPAVFESLVTL